MMKLLVLVLALSVAQAWPSRRERRQANGCVDAFTNVPSPCTNNPTKQVYFPHPIDSTKFLQCDVFGRMYVIQCPKGEMYNIATTSCSTFGQATLPPVTGSPSQGGNPCTPGNIAKNNIYFAISGDSNHFIECDLKGNANVMTCPSGLYWNPTVIACVYPASYNTAPPVVGHTTQRPGGTGSSNPCNAQALASGKFFFPVSDPHKFIQCDPWGDVYINSCPAGLIWNNHLETCYSPFQINGVNP